MILLHYGIVSLHSLGHLLKENGIFLGDAVCLVGDTVALAGETLKEGELKDGVAEKILVF